MSLIDLIKRTSVKAVEASGPANFLYGAISSVNPLEIELHQKLTLTEEFLIITERVTRYEVDLEHTHTYTDDGSQSTTGKALTHLLTKTPIRTGLKIGDKVVLGKVHGGHKYIVLDKVVGGL